MKPLPKFFSNQDLFIQPSTTILFYVCLVLFVSCFIFSDRLFIKRRPTDGEYQESEVPDLVNDPEGDNNDGKS